MQHFSDLETRTARLHLLQRELEVSDGVYANGLLELVQEEVDAYFDGKAPHQLAEDEFYGEAALRLFNDGYDTPEVADFIIALLGSKNGDAADSILRQRMGDRHERMRYALDSYEGKYSDK